MTAWPSMLLLRECCQIFPKCKPYHKMKLLTLWSVPSEMEPFYLLHFTYGMDYTRKGVFTPGKYGEWRFDKRTYAQLPPPRHLSEPPRGMKNALVSDCASCQRAAVQLQAVACSGRVPAHACTVFDPV
jgi:hypothetical protein